VTVNREPTDSAAFSADRHAVAGQQSGRRRRGGGRGEPAMVPEAHFTSYYGRAVLKPPVWHHDIAAYLFLGGLAAGSSLLGAGADVSGRPTLRRAGRLTALAAIIGSLYALVHDLGRPSRFLNMLRVAKPTSPMSVGTWILSAYGPLVGVAAVSEGAALLPRRGAFGLVRRVLPAAGTGAGLGAAAIAPAVATYTAVLVADTATPTWHAGYRQLPFVFAGSAAAAAGGMGLLAAPVREAGPARRAAVLGGALELAAEQRMERAMGIVAEPLHEGRAGTLMRAAKTLTAGGAMGALVGGRSRVVSALSGAALLAGSACTRFGVFDAGVASAKDPKYTVLPQRERVERQQARVDGDRSG
jgi:hypothetical protein